MTRRLRASRTSIIVLVLVVVVATLRSGPPAPAQAQGVTVEQLAGAVLGPDDLGPGYFIVDESVSTESLEVLRILFRIEPEPERVYVGLEADVPIDAQAIAESNVGNLPTELGLQDATISDALAAEWLVPGATSYQFAGVSGGSPRLGFLYLWQQGPVFAVLVVITASEDGGKQAAVTAARYAELQRDKLSAVCAPCVPS